MELSTYISSFREVNSIYAKFIETGLYGFDEQEIVINFFEEIKDIKNEITNLNKRIEDMDGEIVSNIDKEDKKPPHY